MHKSTLQKLAYISTIILTLLLFISCTSTNTGAMEENDPMSGTVVLENNGAQSYSVARIDGEGISAETGTANPSITLTVGGRYTFVNQAGASSHPLDFRNGDRQKLFGQSNTDGSFDNDNEVNVVKNGDSITFTLTESLAAELADYICSFHPGMNGDLVLLNE